jgi:phage-related protein (TIGR01555 family)
LVRLFGQSPAGLNATGESDLSNYYDNINQQQERRLRTPLHKLIRIVSLSTLGRDVPEGFEFDFKSLWQIDDSTKAEIADKVTSAVCKAEEQGLISRQTAMKELRQSSETTGIYSNISDEEIKDAEDDPPRPSELDDGEITPHTEPSEKGGDPLREPVTEDS